MFERNENIVLKIHVLFPRGKSFFQVNTVKIGPYVMVYDKQNKNLSTFKK